MGKVLADTSVWASFFRGASSVFTDQLADLLANDAVCTTSIIRAELLSGTHNENEYRALADMLSVIDRLDETADFWDRVAHARFRLARRGVQASITDLTIAVMAYDHRCPLLTEDKDVRAISHAVPFEFFK
jgi:predicted nucleic acid-binding protein